MKIRDLIGLVLLAVVLITGLASASPARAEGADPLICENAPAPTIAEADLRLNGPDGQSGEPELYVLAHGNLTDARMYASGKIVFDYCYGIKHKITTYGQWLETRVQRSREYFALMGGSNPYKDDGTYTLMYQLLIPVYRQLHQLQPK